MNKMIYDMMIDDWLIEKGYLCQIVINLRKLNIISENHYLASQKMCDYVGTRYINNKG